MSEAIPNGSRLRLATVWILAATDRLSRWVYFVNPTYGLRVYAEGECAQCFRGVMPGSDHRTVGIARQRIGKAGVERGVLERHAQFALHAPDIQPA